MRPLRFFLAVPLQSPVMVAGLALALVSGGVQLVLAPQSGRQVVSTLLFLQLFSASAGFAIPARRGHYDAVLTGGATRHAVIASHVAMAVAPGVLAWVLLGAVEWALGGRAVWSSGSVSALGLLSLGGWALSVPLPRLSGGVIWLVVLFAGAGWSGTLRTGLLEVALGGGSGASRVLVSAVCPLLLAGLPLTAAGAAAVVPAGLLVALAVGLAWRWLARMDVGLEAAQ